MNRGEEADRPITGDDPLTPGEPAEPGRPGAVEETAEPSSLLSVIIAGDGSAAIDGVPVPVVPGESVDVAVLDTLHGYARSRDAPVTAAISDPAAGYVAIVEVASDGSSRLLEQHHEQEPTGHAGPAGSTERGVLAGPFQGAGPFDVDQFDADDADDADEVAAPPQPAGPRVTPPALGPDPDREPGRRKALSQSDDEYEGPGLLQRPLVVGTVGVAVAALVIGSLVALGSGGSEGGQNQAAGTGTEADKSPTNLQPPPPPPPSEFMSASPSVSPSPSSSSSAPDPPPVSPTPTPTPTPTQTSTRPAQETAAIAVSKLAARSPGRHICYRAYFEHSGWQKPVCDGATAGAVKGDKKIKSLNIAVSGTKGTAANAYLHDDGWWKTPWPGVVDGMDNYINSTRKNAPYMLGFAINVGEGTVCQNAYVHTKGWHGLACDEPGSHIFGGTLDNSLWLKAVRFTV
ncbi:hypothetical protein F7R91_31455 [Streptomyces luteolifulvus]|uniref:Hydrophobic W protein n=1 Tax=Streptomyces luteolifulvus TaxID=2615112 RepID=A0A6H9UUJ2_9ACTN|nr:hypothetical protein [Streptomyces luteolifulvus]KAB1141729.1 hypothetical protein F7R91_31455 [Streptomyces luteolifulvus]